MLNWNINPVRDDSLGLADVAGEIASLVSSVCSEYKKCALFEPIWEVFTNDESIGRAVVQFTVGAELFDLFFNHPLGYRGFFRRGPWMGTAVNSLIICEIKLALATKISDQVQAHVLKCGPTVHGEVRLERSTFLRSLDPSLSKVWYSTAAVTSTGELCRLPSGVSAERIDVGLQETWMKIAQESSECVIEVKGAFVGKSGLFQVKDPEIRARTLSERGEA